MSKYGSLVSRQFLQLFIPAVLLTTAAAWFVGQARIDAEFSLIRANEKLVTGISAGRLHSQLQGPVRHLLAVAEEAPVRLAIESGEPGAAALMATAFMTLLSRNTDYDEVRWLDETGMERVRVNNVSGHPAVALEQDLQNKSDRYYFQEAMRIGKGNIYFSQLDLNVENGQIELPYKPMQRVAMPVYDKQGRPRGILIINVAAQTFLQSFAAEDDAKYPHLMLLNQDGFWLKSPNAADEWGFMFKRMETLASRFPQAWAQMTNAKSGQVELTDGLWTWQTVEPEDVISTQQSRRLLVVSHLPAQMLAPIYLRSWTPIGGLAVLILLVSGMLIGRLIQVRDRQRQADIATAAALAKAEVLSQQIDAQKRFRHVVEASIDGILVTDGEGHIVLVNPALADMFDYAPAELMNQSIDILLPEAARQRHTQHRVEYMRHPDKRAMGAGRELLGQRRDGSQFPVEVGLSTYVSKGQIFVLATVVDITERNQLVAASKRLASIITSTEDAIISKTLDGIITSWNPGAEKLFGYRAEEVIGRSIELLVPPGQEQEERALLARIARGETIAHYDTIRQCKDGRQVVISNTICPLRDALGRVIGASKIARDISEIKQAEAQIHRLNASLQQRVKELAAANEELDSFAYAVSHDLRAPLRAMIGFSHALLEDCGEHLDDEGRAYLSEIDIASRRMGDLIDGILTLSRSTRGELRNEAIDLSAMALRISHDIVRTEPARSVAWEIAPDLETWGDPRLIENVLRNLMGNAWKYTAGRVDAAIRVHAEDEDGQRWICVSDNGAGFDMRHADKLYQPFQRLHRQDEFAGLGIGLATVLRIINRHHGKLRATAEPGKGATFAFSLPRVSEAPQEEVA